MKKNTRIKIIFALIFILTFNLFAENKKNMADSDSEVEKLDLLTILSNDNLVTKYGNSAENVRKGDLKNDWYFYPTSNNESVFTRTENGFILERKTKFKETWQGNVDSPYLLVHPKKKYKVSLKAKASNPVTVALALNKKGPPWDNAGFWQTINLQKDFKNFSFTFTVPADAYCAISLTEVGLLSDVIIELEDYHFEEIK